MTAKEFLRGIRGHERRIKALMERRQHYYDLAMQGTGTREARRIGGTNQASRVEDAVCRLIDLEGDLDKEIDRLVDEVRLAERLIDQLEDSRHRDILRHRYLDGWSWERIAHEMNYDRSWVLRLHGEGLINFQKLYSIIWIDADHEICPSLKKTHRTSD